MYKFFACIRVSRWHEIGSLAVGRVPTAVAAAAVLATAATSVGFSDRLHPAVSPIVFYSANPRLLSPSASCVPQTPSSRILPASGLKFATEVQSPTLISLARRASNFLASSTLYSASEYLSVSRFGHSLLRRNDYLICPPLLNISPSTLLFTSLLGRDKLQRSVHDQGFHGAASISPGVVHSSLVRAPLSPENFPAFDTFDLSTQLGRILSSLTSTPTHPHPSTIRANALHNWHRPALGSSDVDGAWANRKPVTVVLLGWLGSQQKHLKKYAEWYNARGIDAVTFTLPMADILNLSMGGRAEEQVERLTDQLSTWLSEESRNEKGSERQLIFHTFSNTGWLTYGVVLENLSTSGNEWIDRIKGCVVDSAPAAELDPHVWACGFSAAILKKRSNGSREDFTDQPEFPNAPNAAVVRTAQPFVAESALLVLLENFFSLFLRIPAINQRLSKVVSVLSKQQPACPQLYIYSTADKVIPVNLVESFMEKQRQLGRTVRGCNFQSSPHVDHFRTFPESYGNHVSTFLQECLEKTSLKPN